MAIQRRSRRPRLTLLVLLLLSVTIVTLDYRGELTGSIRSLRSAASDVFSPLQAGVDGVLRPVGNLVAGAFHYGSVVRENARLRQEVGELRRRAAEVAAAGQKVREILQQASLPWVGSLPEIPAEVIDLGTSNFELTIELDKGTRSGVAVGEPVISGAGLLGRIIQASASRSTVLLLTDPRSQVSVDVGSGSATTLALASGEGAGHPLRLQYVQPGTKFRRGTTVLTSGLQGALFPPDLPVGTVISTRQPAASLQESVTIKPAADMSQLRYVTVLVWEPAP